ncbi:MAG: HEPN domain-containing protein [Acidobacteria bacterium]|nr:HEPN domain-containing protein [Acidobacteriota bacterium]MDW7984349.1 HEPN domain-containing protein [Acidobacteriota bacterium]
MVHRYTGGSRRAEADLRHALDDRDFEWSYLATQQAVEKALKALFQKLGMEAWGRTLTALIGNLPLDVRLTQDLIDCARTLDKHYILTRSPNRSDTGTPQILYPAGCRGGGAP